MASEYFDRVTGSNDYERQSWRDSYNNGRAAGDWTGGVNARLDRERAASGGFTNSGSSRELSAGQAASYRDSNEVATLKRNREKAVAQGNTNTVRKIDAALAAFATPTVRPNGTGGVVMTPALVTAGPGSPASAKGHGATSGPGGIPQPSASPSAGPSAPAAVSVPTGNVSITLGIGPGALGIPATAPLKPKIKDVATGGFAGWQIEANPWFSDVENFGEPRYGEPGEWLGGLVNMGADAVWNAGRAWNATGRPGDIGSTVDRLQRNLGGWISDAPNRVNGPMPRQEPVDWGR